MKVESPYAGRLSQSRQCPVRAPCATALADFERYARRFIVGIADIKRLVQFEIADVRQPVGRVVDAGGAGAALACGIETFAAATLAAAIPAPDKNFRRPTSHHLTSFHGALPVSFDRVIRCRATAQ